MRRWIGGDISWEQRLPLIKKHLWPRQRHNLGIGYQCRCGSIEYVKYRGWWYCPRCGRRGSPLQSSPPGRAAGHQDQGDVGPC